MRGVSESTPRVRSSILAPPTSRRTTSQGVKRKGKVMTDLKTRQAKYREALLHWKRLMAGERLIYDVAEKMGTDEKTLTKAHHLFVDAALLLCPWILHGKEYFGEDFQEWCDTIK